MDLMTETLCQLNTSWPRFSPLLLHHWGNIFLMVLRHCVKASLFPHPSHEVLIKSNIHGVFCLLLKARQMNQLENLKFSLIRVMIYQMNMIMMRQIELTASGPLVTSWEIGSSRDQRRGIVTS